jgi:hypothetical protein
MDFHRRWFLGYAAAAPAAVGQGGRVGTPQSGLAKELESAMAGVKLFNTHEHLLPERERVSQQVDFFTLAGHYTINDAVSAGLSLEGMTVVNDAKRTASDRWEVFAPHWPMVRHTGYGQALSLAISDLYGIREISKATLPAINRAIAEANVPGLYDRVLKERANIEWCLVDAYWNTKPAPLDRPDFLLSHRFDAFVAPSTRKDIETLEGVSGESIHSLTDLKKAAEKTFAQGLKVGMVAIKSGLAYRRELLFEETSESDAARDFEALVKGETELPRGWRFYKQRVFRRLEDHMFHHVLRLADAHRVPVQIHTGLPAGNRGFLENMNPRLLANLFILFPRTKFDLFHIGFPYQQELGTLAKIFPNVYADFCWAHVVSPPASRSTLDEYLESVPLNKILGFGGDYRYPELTYAHAKMARRNVAQVLAGKVEAGTMTEADALQAGRLILRENALALFGTGKRQPQASR